MTDEDLVLYYKKHKEQRVIALLFDRYVHLVFASCMKYLKDEEIARDTCMDIFEGLPEKIMKHEISSFKSWLFVITKNTCLMSLRKDKKILLHVNTEDLCNNFVEEEDYLHPNYKEREEKILIETMQNLRLEQRVCIEYMYLKDKSYKEIAEETGYGLKQVKSYIQNGKRNLKIMLEKAYEQQA